MITFMAALLFVASAHAGSGIVTVKGSITKASNPNGRCGASTFGYIISATQTKADGSMEDSMACLESLAIPLGGMIAGLSTNLYMDSLNTLKELAGKNVTMEFATSNIEELDLSSATLLSIKAD